MSEPRRHHYLPQFYLDNFVDENGRLWVLDKPKFQQFNTSPKNVAHERDFFKIEGNTEDPYAVEKFLAEIEGKVAPILRKVITCFELPTGEDWELLLYFVALNAAKVPQKRAVCDDFWGQLGKIVSGILLKGEDRWKSTVLRAGIDLKGKTPEEAYTSVKKAFDDGKLQFKGNQSAFLDFFSQTSKVISNLLPHRNWSLYVSKQSKFVTSDNPVVLQWMQPVEGPYPPGFGLNGTYVFFPLSPNVTLTGTFEPLPPYRELSIQAVGTLNHLQLIHADRFVFSTNREFETCVDAKTMMIASEVIETARRKETAQSGQR